MALTITVKIGQVVTIGKDIAIKLYPTRSPNQIKVSIKAPSDLKITRERNDPYEYTIPR